MNCQPGRRSFCLAVLSVLPALLFTGTSARAQTLYNLDWARRFNNSIGTETEDNWVANSYRVRAGGTHIGAVSLPIGGNYTDQPISALIYQGYDLLDPTAGGGLILLSQTDTTITTKTGDLLTLTLDNPVDLSVGDIFYAAVLIPGVTGDYFPFYNDIAAASPSQSIPTVGTNPFARSFFDAGLAPGAPYDINQGSDNITVLGGTHPVLGPGIQTPGNLALWVNATP
jgi:hypothetical protein